MARPVRGDAATVVADVQRIWIACRILVSSFSDSKISFPMIGASTVVTSNVKEALAGVLSSSVSVAQEAVGWLDHQLPLPGGYKTTRRDLLKLLPLAGLAGTGYAVVQNAKVGYAQNCMSISMAGTFILQL